MSLAKWSRQSIPAKPRPAAGAAAGGLRRELGLFDATMVVMGGIVGAGIFINPYVVARQVDRPVEILGAWALGGVIALAGAFIYAELAARMPEVGGQYAYLREAYHPGVAFLYGWVLLLVVQTGGMAAVAIIFARYFLELAPVPLGESALAALALLGLAAINCLGVRAGGRVQSGLMVLKILALAALVAAGWLAGGRTPLLAPAHATHPAAGGFTAWTAFGTIAFPRLLAGDVEELCARLRDRHETSVVPGRFFDLPEHFRIGIGGAEETVQPGLERLARALGEMRGGRA
jgi:basic amino acid/polyamine antiporter, APA family